MKEKSSLILRGLRQRRRRWIIVTGLLSVLAGTLCCAMLLFGDKIYPIEEIVASLFGRQIAGISFIVITLRLPRMLAGLFAGFAFGVAGYLFQTILRNPLANPNVLGITSGSSAAAVLCMTVLHTSDTMVSVASIIAGFATVMIMYGLSRGESFSIGRLILIGIAMQAMLDAVISYLLLASAQQDLPAALQWLSGSLNGVQIEKLPSLIVTVIFLTVVAILFGKSLTTLALGEEIAISLGVAVNQTRILLVVSSVLLIAMATAVTGPIAFISFLAGPIANRLAGIGFSNIIPAGLVGADLVLLADLTGQFAFAYRFPVGVVTGLLGAPYLIWLLIRMNREGAL